MGMDSTYKHKRSFDIITELCSMLIANTDTDPLVGPVSITRYPINVVDSTDKVNPVY
jgi:hypothetical protein